MFRSMIFSAAMAAMIAVGTTGTAFASPSEDENAREIAAVLGTKTTLAAAIAAAEQQTGGRAIEASLEDEDGTSLFKVEVARDNAVHKVTLDSATGKVINVTIAKHEDEDD